MPTDPRKEGRQGLNEPNRGPNIISTDTNYHGKKRRLVTHRKTGLVAEGDTTEEAVDNLRDAMDLLDEVKRIHGL